MKKAVCFLSILTLILGSVAVALWLLPISGYKRDVIKNGYGLYEGLELVTVTDRYGNRIHCVTDSAGRKLFDITVRSCTLDTRFRNGRLHFRMNGTGREGFIDRNGVAVFSGDSIQPPGKDIAKGRVNMADGIADDDGGDAKEYMATDSELRRMASDNPFVKEAAKILSGKLDEDDASKRRVILNYCEHLRTAYTTKDIDFLKQLFSEQALIIVGNVVKPRPTDDSRYMPEERVKYFIRTKREYIARLEKAFNTNSKIDLKFSDFHIMRHPTMNGIYGVTLRQRYESDNYSDDGYLFLLWDFRNKSMPLIHVRTWQPANTIGKEDEVISISDFNLE